MKCLLFSIVSILLSYSCTNIKESIIDTQTGEKVAGKYATSKGVKSGDPAQKALKIYGKPKARILDYSKDEEHRIHWVFYGLFYESLAIFTDSAFTTVIGITVGEGLDLKRRHIKK
ncbi:MAG: hypothetical protein H6565_05085 [Lewinellaceae bacterium]|nr:hypothetical protein [Lewinellaceae bacterium]MCB9354749.1 hypothetical protein [Lewinellaceae bacterium]